MGNAKLPAKTTAKESVKQPVKTATESHLACPAAKTTARKRGIKKLLAAVDRYSTEVTEALEAESPVCVNSKEQKESLTLPPTEEVLDTAADKDLLIPGAKSTPPTSAKSNHSREPRLVATG